MFDFMSDKKYFEKFYRENIDKIYRFVFFRIGANKELAEDLVSEIFMKALESFDRYDEKISRSAWIFTIAKNHLINHWRDAKPIDSLPEITEEGMESGSWVKKSLEIHAKSNTKGEVYELLAKLDENDREIVTFHYLLGYSYLEIARMRNSTENAIKVAAHRAIKKMRKLI